MATPDSSSNGTYNRRVLLLTTVRSYRNQAFQQAAKRLGIEIVLGLDMAAELAEEWSYPLGLDFSRPDVAAAAIADYAVRTPIDAVLGVDDSGTLIAAKASALLGLPHNSPLAAEGARNKYRMRRMMAEGGVPCPGFQRFCTDADAYQLAQQISFPCVIKPLDLNGSRGVMRADNPQGFVVAVERLTHMLAAENPDGAPWPYLVEDFIPGFEVALEGMLDAGQLEVLALFDKPDPLDGPFFEETIYVTLSRLPPETQAAIERCVSLAAVALGLRIGPIHAELRVNEQGPWMLELAGRSIGGLCSQALRFGVDRSLEELILRQVVGLPNQEIGSSVPASGVMMIPIPHGGVLTAVSGQDDALAVPGIVGLEITAKLYYSIQPLPEGASYLGFIFAEGETPAIVEDALRRAHAKLHFTISKELPLHL